MQSQQVILSHHPNTLYTITLKSNQTNNQNNQQQNQQVYCQYCDINNNINNNNAQNLFCIHMIEGYYTKNKVLKQIQVSVQIGKQQYFKNPPNLSKFRIKDARNQRKSYYRQDDYQRIIIKLPYIVQTVNGDLNKTIIDKIIECSQTFKPQNSKNKISVHQMKLNTCSKKSLSHYFVHAITPNKIESQSQNKILCINSKNPLKLSKFRDATYFINNKQLREYINLNYQKAFQLSKNNLQNTQYLTKLNTQYTRFLIFGIYHILQTKNNNKIAFIDMIFLKHYQKQGDDWVLKNQVRLQQLSINLNNQFNEMTYQNYQIKYNYEISHFAQFDLKKQNMQKKCSQQINAYKQPYYIQKWQSTIDLQYSLKQLLRKFTFNVKPIYQKNNKKSKSDILQSHYAIQFALNESQAFIIIVYNHETLMDQVIESYSRQTNRPQIFSNIRKQHAWISNLVRLKYPCDYYLALYQKYSDLIMLAHNNQNEQNTEKIIQHDFIIKILNKDELIRLAKYLMIQNIKFCQISTQRKQQMYNNYSLPENYLNHNIKQIMKLQYDSLSYNPISSTLIIYWMLGPPGSEKTTILSQIQGTISDYNAPFLKVNKFQLFAKVLQTFLEKLKQTGQPPTLHKANRHKFCLLDIYFTPNRLQEIAKIIQNHLPSQMYYQICIITPQIIEPITFFSQWDQKSRFFDNQCQIQTSTVPYKTSIKTHYYFSLSFLLSAILTIQMRPPTTQSTLHGMGTQSLSTMLHYISSTYTNLDIQRLIGNCDVYGGHIKIIQYSIKQRLKVNYDTLQICQLEQIQDQLRVLLELSFKSKIDEDVLLTYFLDNIQQLQFQFKTEQIGQQIINSTFQVLPYYLNRKQINIQY